MRKVYYMVGRDGYFTRVETLERAKVQQSADSNYIIKTCLEKVEESKPKLSPLGKKLMGLL